MPDELLYRYLRAEATDDERRRVEAWLAGSPANPVRLAELGTLLDLADRAEAALPSSAPPPSAVLVARAEARAPRAPLAALGRWLVPATVGLAAAAVVVIAGVVGYRQLPAFGFGAREVLTGPGETATVALSDGTLIKLGPGTRLRIGTGRREREVALDGHAFVDAAGGHELDVLTRAGQVAALGARFDLDARGEDLRITVAGGTAIVARHGDRQQLTAGRTTAIQGGELLAPWPAPDLADRIRWAGDLRAAVAPCDLGAFPCRSPAAPAPGDSTH